MCDRTVEKDTGTEVDWAGLGARGDHDIHGQLDHQVARLRGFSGAVVLNGLTSPVSGAIHLEAA